MVWCWSLAAEMQFYVVSPIFLLSLLSFLITKQYNLMHCNFSQLHLYIDDLETFFNSVFMYADKLYFKPYTRISSYLTGVLLGYYFYGKNFKDIKNRWVSCIVVVKFKFMSLNN
ncbi:hypothetical protein AVEN_98882-1 [Araneus ventricosus]|uniref:Uncharacterized protein n=1 Tax=Araneus ventricosus TaxID=182803 RepID=A0A4Y2FU33_ARAVE|nr:hypothetical protein AVEN_98882-1 [Araneus ventricosus]